MKPTSYTHYFVLPSGEWLYALKRHFPYLMLEEFFTTYFSNLNFMLEEGWQIVQTSAWDEESSFKAAVSMLTTLVISDVEGMGPSPQQFDMPEVDALHRFVWELTWELLRTLHPECWQHVDLRFIRTVGRDMLLAYHGDRPFSCPVPGDIPFLPPRWEED